MKFLKKAVSALLASVMCIPSGILSFAAAEEENQVTTVTLSDTENGLMQFSEGCMESSTASQDGYHMMQVNEDGELEQIENDGSVWAFNYGDPVEIELLPDEGFHVKSFTIKNSSTGGIMSSKNTMDNVFSFTMPDESIIIEAEFSSSSTVNVVPDGQIRKEQDVAAGTGEESQKEPANNEKSEDDGKNEEDGSGKNGGELNVTSMYHDITKEPEVSESEVEEVIFDLATESYIKANANPQYLSLDGTNEPVDVLQVKQTLFDGKYTQKEDSIDSVMSSIEYGDADMDESINKFLGQIRSAVYVYNYSQDSDYYVAYANTMQRDEGYHVQDFAFAYNDNTGTALEGCIYDSSTGLLYIPKRFYEQISGKFKDDEGNIIIGSLQVQFMQVYSEPGSIQGRAAAYSNEEISVPDLQSNVCTVGADEDENSISVDNSNSSVFDLETITTVDAGMDADHMTVLVNGAPLSKEAYLYDSDTGELKLAISSAAIISIEAYENGETIKEQILDIVSDDADAVSFQNVTYDQMHSLGTIQINDKDRLPKKSNKNLFKPFQVKGELGYSANYSGMENYYISWNGAGGTLDTMQKQLAEYIAGKSDSTSGFKPATIMDGSDMHIRSNLSAAVPARTADKWIEDKKGVNLVPFVRKIGNVPTHCAHITKAGFNNTLPAGTFAVRVVSIHDASEKTKNGVWTATGGYIILAFMSATICKQTTCEFVKVGFAGKAEEKESIDPLCFALVKDANTSRLDAGSPLTNAKLAGTRFKCDFYEDERFDSVGALKNSKKKATASWDFTAYKYAAKGSTTYQKFIRDVLESDDYSSSAYDLSGIDFFPKNFRNGDDVTPRKDWINNFIDQDDLSSWRSNFGKKGTYHIYEVESGKGFLNEGKITDYYKSGISSNSTEDGMVVYFSADASKESVNKVLVNGQESSGSLLGTNKKEPGAPLYFKDRLDIIKLSSVASTAEGMESGEQVQTAEADSGPIRLYDKVIVTLFRENVDNATYYVTTSLYDKTDKKYLDVEWDTSGGGKVIEGVEESDDNFMVPSSIVHTFKASDAEITGDGNPPSYRLKVYGTIPTEGMEDHELVFMNSVYAIDNDKVEDEDMLDPGEDAEGFVKQLGALNTAFVKSEENEASEYITFKKTEPGLDTSISDSEIKRKSGTGEAMTNAGPSRSLVDKISYNGLSSGKKYTVKGWLVDSETNDKFKDAGGTTVEVSEEKTAEGEIGSWDITFNFDATGFEGKKLVAFVEVYDGSELVFDHKDIDDLQETVIITKVTSELKDDDTQEHISAAGDVSLTDTITYENFIPGANYKINSRLVDAETGENATDKDGNEMKKETIVTADPRTGSGTFDVNLEFDIEAGDEAKFLVAYQDIQVENGADGSGDWVTVAEDEDAEDESQTVVVPSIKTFAKDQKTDYNISFAEKNVNIYDTIHYEGLEPDQEYTIISKLVDKDTGDVVIDDDYKEQIIESTFVTKESFDTGKYGAYGDVIPGNHDGDGVTFSLNAESFAGKTVVIFEELYKDGKLIADHQDIANENQTIYCLYNGVKTLAFRRNL